MTTASGAGDRAAGVLDDARVAALAVGDVDHLLADRDEAPEQRGANRMLPLRPDPRQAARRQGFEREERMRDLAEHARRAQRRPHGIRWCIEHELQLDAHVPSLRQCIAGMRYWLGVVQRSHVLRGVALGIAQTNHGVKSGIKRMQPGDGLVYYSPKTSYPDGDPLREFTAIGRIADGEAWQADER